VSALAAAELARSPNAAALLEPLCRCCVERLMGDDRRSIPDLLTVAAAVLNEIDGGRDIPAEVAEEILGLLEGRVRADLGRHTQDVET
jgi:hypothetical protein